MSDRNYILRNVEAIRGDFPILKELIHGKPLVYLDSAATTQKPLKVIERISNFYLHENSNIHRSVHHLGEEATVAYEGGRDRVRDFINAEKSPEIIFTRGATEAINLVAATYGAAHIGAGDEIVVTEMEHHSNIVPWQLLCRRKGAVLRVLPINDRGELIMEELEPLLSDRTRLVAICHVSNSLGTINPVKEVIQRAHARAIPVLVDGAQATPHFRVDVRDLDADFYVFSSHKMFGPTGIGVLYGKESLLEEMPPYQSGGDMISMVTFEETRYNTLPYKFEAGTPNIAGVIAFAAALDYIDEVGIELIAENDRKILAYATTRAEAVEGIRLIGTAEKKVSIVSFVVDGIHPHDLGTILDSQGIAIRAGHHCAMPVVKHFHVPATARASFCIYNTLDEVDRLFAGVEKAREVLL